MLTPEQAALRDLCVAGEPFASPDDECVCDKHDTIVCGVGFDTDDAEVDGVLGTNTAQALAEALGTIAALARENEAANAKHLRLELRCEVLAADHLTPHGQTLKAVDDAIGWLECKDDNRSIEEAVGVLRTARANARPTAFREAQAEQAFDYDQAVRNRSIETQRLAATVRGYINEIAALRAADPRQSSEWARLAEASLGWDALLNGQPSQASQHQWHCKIAESARDLIAKHGGGNDR